MAFYLRRIVSGNKRRYQQDGYDLDLAYITERIIAMGFPAEGREGLYRNPLTQTSRFLEQFHAGHYRVYNLCSERQYHPDKLGGCVVRFPFDDHQPASFQLMSEFCEDVEAHLAENSENVVAVHCKAGKGRTGLMICAYLVHTGMPAEEALSLYDSKRAIPNHKALKLASQRRYVEYYQRVLQEAELEPRRLRLQHLRITGLAKGALDRVVVALWTRPSGTAKAKAYVTISSDGGSLDVNKRLRQVRGREAPGLVHTRDAGTSGLFIDFRQQQQPLPARRGGGWMVEGDIKIQVFAGRPGRSTSLCFTWFHTWFVSDLRYTATRSQLDKVQSTVPKDVLLEVAFEEVPDYERTWSMASSRNGSFITHDAPPPHASGATAQRGATIELAALSPQQVARFRDQQFNP